MTLIPNNVNAGALPTGVGPTTQIEGGITADTVNTTYTVSITFSADVTGFVLGDITKSGTATATLTNFTTINASNYTVDVPPTTNGTVILSVAAGVCFDASSRPNSISNTLTTRVLLVPVNTVLPVASGTTLQVGDVLSVTNGTWLNTPTGYAYQWIREDTLIGGATSSSYTVVSGDDQRALWCRVTASNAAGNGVGVFSNHLAIGFSSNNSDFWVDATQSNINSGIPQDNDSLLRPALTSSDSHAYTTTLVGTGSYRYTPSYNGEGIYFNRTGGWLYDAASTWKYLHDNSTSWTLYLLVKPIQSESTSVTFLSTATGTTGNSSIGLRIVRVNNTYKISICNGAGGTEPYVITGTTNALTINAYNTLKVTFDNTGGGLSAWVLPFGGSYTSIGTDGSGAGLSSSNPATALTVGNTGTDFCYLKHILIFKQLLSGPHTTAIESWLASQSAQTITPTNVNIYFFAGQSNNGSAPNPPAGGLTGKQGAHIFFLPSDGDNYSSGFWAEYEYPVNHNSNLATHGYQLKFGHDMNQLAPTYVIGHWIGASGLCSSLYTNSWSAINPSSNIDHFPYFTDGFYISQGTAAIVMDGLKELTHIKRKIPVIRGAIWCQGEAEAGNAATVQSDYANELEQYFVTLATKLTNNGYSPAKMRIAVLRTSGSRVPSGNLVQGAQSDAVTWLNGHGYNATLIDTDGYGIAGGHYNASGQASGATDLYSYFSPYYNE